jgi:hypothetical protein
MVDCRAARRMPVTDESHLIWGAAAVPKTTDQAYGRHPPRSKLLLGAVVAMIVCIFLSKYPDAGDAESSAPPTHNLPTSKPPIRPTIKVSTLFGAMVAARDLINEAGNSCDAVTSLSPIGAIQSGGGVLRANCSNGDQYVVVLSDDDRMRFLSSCTAFAVATGSGC